jgi:hypothetical protein
MELDLPEIRLLAAATAAGVLAHLCVFRVGEWDVVSPSIFSSHIVVFGLALGASHYELLFVSIQYTVWMARWPVFM